MKGPVINLPNGISLARIPLGLAACYTVWLRLTVPALCRDGTRRTSTTPENLPIAPLRVSTTSASGAQSPFFLMFPLIER